MRKRAGKPRDLSRGWKRRQSTHIEHNATHILKMKGSGCTKYIRRNNVFNLGYHIIFCPKYRKPYLLRFESLIRSCILKTSIKFQFLVAEIDIMPDHIHLFIKCKTTTMPISKIIGHLKGFSSYTIRKSYRKSVRKSSVTDHIGYFRADVMRFPA